MYIRNVRAVVKAIAKGQQAQALASLNTLAIRAAKRKNNAQAQALAAHYAICAQRLAR